MLHTRLAQTPSYSGWFPRWHTGSSSSRVFEPRRTTIINNVYYFRSFQCAFVHYSDSVDKAFKELEACPGSTWKDIRLQYKKMAKVYHPDVSSSSEAHEKFARIQESFRLLEKVYKKSEQLARIAQEENDYAQFSEESTFIRPHHDRQILHHNIEDMEEEQIEKPENYYKVDDKEKKLFLLWGAISGGYVVGFMTLGYWVPWLLNL